MNNPWPTPRQRRIARRAEGLLDAQAAATVRFRSIVTCARLMIGEIAFPLGAPSRGYDLADFDATLADWLIARDETVVADDALDRATALDDVGADFAVAELLAIAAEAKAP